MTEGAVARSEIPVVMQEHHDPVLSEGPAEPLQPVLLHARIAMGHGDGGMRAHFHLGPEEPTAEAITALNLEVYVAPLDHHVLHSDESCRQGLKAGPGDRAIAGYCRPYLGRSAHRDCVRRSRYAA